MASSDLIETFSGCGGLLKGHFGLTSGRHSSVYLQCALVLQYPDIARQIGAELAQLARDTFSQSGSGEIDTVIVAFPDSFGRLVGKRFMGRFFLDHIAGSATHCCNPAIAR